MSEYTRGKPKNPRSLGPSVSLPSLYLYSSAGSLHMFYRRHTIAEQSLTADAQKLKEEVQQAVTEIDTLHSDIAQRKARAQKNEATADDYRKNVDTKYVFDLRVFVLSFLTSYGHDVGVQPFGRHLVSFDLTTTLLILEA